MRTAAQTYTNAYIVGIFACCREIFIVTQHSECISLADKNEIYLIKRLADRRRMEELMKHLSIYFASIVDVKKESLNNEMRQRQALKAIQDDRQIRLEQE